MNAISPVASVAGRKVAFRRPWLFLCLRPKPMSTSTGSTCSTAAFEARPIVGSICHVCFGCSSPNSHINRIRYFTALVRSTGNDPGKSQRQQTYLRALKTIPKLSVHYGQFLTNIIKMPLAKPIKGGPTVVEVRKTEEKGSDVNLATYLLVDGFRGEYDLAVIVSNDSDLIEPMRFVRMELGYKVGILAPHKRTSWALRNGADFYRPIRQGPLSVSQFQDTLTDSAGTITKPPGW